MALINNPNLVSAIQQELLQAADRQGAIDTSALTNIINGFLPPEEQLARGVGVTTGVYKRFGEFDKVDARTEVVTTGLWSGDAGQLTQFFTSSAQTTATTSNLSGNYYYNVYDKDPSDTTAEVQFAVAYGNVNGTGSLSLSDFPGSTLASKAVYSQYRSLLLDPNDDRFTFTSSSGDGVDSDDIYVINVGRARFREKMDPQNWQLALSGSNGEFTFIDDSGKKFDDTVGKTGRVFNIVSGSINVGTSNEATITETYASNGEGYGLFYPDLGLLVFNPSALHTTVGSLEPVAADTGDLTPSGDAQNHKLLFEAIKRGADFDARRTENIQTQHFFCRATNREFNFSNNPTYYDNQTGDILPVGFETDPRAYITTIGLYNDSNELIAVAKSSRPIPKSFSRETLLKIKLEF